MVVHNTRLKKYFFLHLLLFLMLSSVLARAAEPALPRPQGAVNDFAGVLDAAAVQTMENLAREVLEKTGTAIVVAVMASIGDNDPADYANRLYQSWGIGVKGKDKGVLLFLTVKERKVRIETGYGVEGILPDGKVGAILDQYVIPDLRIGQYGQGLTKGFVAVAGVIAQDARVTLTGLPELPEPQARDPRRGTGRLPLLLLLLLLIPLLGTRQGRELLPLLLLLFLGGGRGGGGYGGGGFGGGFGGFGGGGSGGGGSDRSF
jgi:uncharacterized protein